MKSRMLVFLIFSALTLSSNAYGKLSLDCSIADAEAAGAFYLAFSLLSGGDGQVTGDQLYDRELSQYVNSTFSEEDADLVFDQIINNPMTRDSIMEKAQALSRQGYTGQQWMKKLVEFFKDPNNGLCR